MRVEYDNAEFISPFSDERFDSFEDYAEEMFASMLPQREHTKFKKMGICSLDIQLLDDADKKRPLNYPDAKVEEFVARAVDALYTKPWNELADMLLEFVLEFPLPGDSHMGMEMNGSQLPVVPIRPVSRVEFETLGLAGKLEQLSSDDVQSLLDSLISLSQIEIVAVFIQRKFPQSWSADLIPGWTESISSQPQKESLITELSKQPPEYYIVESDSKKLLIVPADAIKHHGRTKPTRNAFMTWLRKNSRRVGKPYVVLQPSISEKYSIPCRQLQENDNAPDESAKSVPKTKKEKVEGKSKPKKSGKEDVEQPIVRPPPPIKYPIPDHEVQHTGVHADSLSPSLSQTFSLPSDCISDALMVWDFCQTFGELVELDSFTFEQFEIALSVPPLNRPSEGDMSYLSDDPQSNVKTFLNLQKEETDLQTPSARLSLSSSISTPPSSSSSSSMDRKSSLRGRKASISTSHSSRQGRNSRSKTLESESESGSDISDSNPDEGSEKSNGDDWSPYECSYSDSAPSKKQHHRSSVQTEKGRSRSSNRRSSKRNNVSSKFSNDDESEQSEVDEDIFDGKMRRSGRLRQISLDSYRSKEKDEKRRMNQRSKAYRRMKLRKIARGIASYSSSEEESDSSLSSSPQEIAATQQHEDDPMGDSWNIRQGLGDSSGVDVLLVQICVRLLDTILSDTSSFSSDYGRDIRQNPHTWQRILYRFLKHLFYEQNMFGRLNALRGPLCVLRVHNYAGFASLTARERLLILSALVHATLDTDFLRKQIDLNVQECLALRAEKWRADREDARAKRDIVNQLKADRDALIQEILAANCDRSCILEAAMMSSELRTSLKINFDDESTFPVDIPMPDFEGPAHLSRAEQRKWVQDQRRSWDEEQAERRKCGSELLDRLRKLDSKLCRPGESVEKEKQKRNETFESRILENAVTTEPIGRDRFNRLYYVFFSCPNEARLFVRDVRLEQKHFENYIGPSSFFTRSSSEDIIFDETMIDKHFLLLDNELETTGRNAQSVISPSLKNSAPRVCNGIQPRRLDFVSDADYSRIPSDHFGLDRSASMRVSSSSGDLRSLSGSQIRPCILPMKENPFFFIDSKQGLDALEAWLDERGVNEKNLLSVLRSWRPRLDSLIERRETEAIKVVEADEGSRRTTRALSHIASRRRNDIGGGDFYGTNDPESHLRVHVSGYRNALARPTRQRKRVFYGE